MAVFKAKFVKRDGQAKAGAKDYIRYFEKRPGRDQAKISRTLFGAEGAMERKDAYRLIDLAQKASVFYKIVINPCPIKEDSQRDLNLRALTEKTMQKIEEIVKKEMTWVAAIHDDHTDKRHIHALAVVNKALNSQELQRLRLTATEAALFQRQQLDLARGLEPSRSTRLVPRKQASGRSLSRRSHKTHVFQTRLSGLGATSSANSSPRENRGVAPPRLQMCTCTHCGLKQVKPYLESKPHCLLCGSQLRFERKILQQTSSTKGRTKEAGWEL